MVSSLLCSEFLHSAKSKLTYPPWLCSHKPFFTLPDAADSGSRRRRPRPRRERLPELEAAETAPRSGRDGAVAAGEQDVAGEVVQSRWIPE